MHLTRLEDDPRSARVGQLAGLPDQGVQEVDGVVVTDGVDAHVSVDTRGGESVLVRVDSGGQDELRGGVEGLDFGPDAKKLV